MSIIDHAAELERLIAERNAFKRELVLAEARFRNVIERNADAIIVVGRDGVVRFANQCASELFDTAHEDIIGSPFGFPVVAGETTELDIVRSGSPRLIEMRVVESAWDGQPAYIASLRDLTQRKQAEEAAQKLIGEQAARRSAEALARKFRQLAEWSSTLASSLDYAETLAVLARLCVAEVADWVVIYTIDTAGNAQRLAVAHRDPAKARAAEALQQRSMDPAGIQPVEQVLQTRQPLLMRSISAAQLRELSQDEEHLQIMTELGIESVMLVPLVARDRAMGAIAFVCADGDAFNENDLTLAEDLAVRAALAIDNARLYREAQSANQVKADFLAVISHDLRTPLNSIMGYAELMTMGIPDPVGPASLQHLDRIRTGATHLLYLLDELLEFARLDAGHEQVRIEQVDLKVIAKDVIALIAPMAAERKLELVLDAPPHPVMFRTDPDRLRQVLVNLTGNAVKYTATGTIRLSLSNTADSVVFAVQDTGAGIAPEHLDRIFEPFWQADTTQRNRGGGTGLGLSIVQRLTALLGGKVTVESKLGAGSTFTVRLARRRSVQLTTEA